MAYADYKFYTEEYGGAMSQTDFERFVKRAAHDMDLASSDKAKTAADSMQTQLKYCNCELAELIFYEENMLQNTQGGSLIQVNNDGYTVAYNSKHDAQQGLRLQKARVMDKYMRQPQNLIPKLVWL